MKKNGFTLAEILITICILGIIAAVTLPAIKTNLDNSVLEKQTLKFYTQMRDAIDLYKVNNETNDIPTNNSTDVVEFAKKYFNIVETCTMNDRMPDCFAAEYSSIKGKKENGYLFSGNENVYKLQDGATFSIMQDGNDGQIMVQFDTNGKKGPNVIGKDFWCLYIYSDSSIDIIDPKTKDILSEEELAALNDILLQRCTEGASAEACFGHFIRNNFKISSKS